MLLPVSQIFYMHVAVYLLVHKQISWPLFANLESGKENKFSPYGVWVLPADGKMALLLCNGEVSTPLCPTFKEETPEYFLVMEEGANPPSFQGVVFRLHTNNICRKLLSSCEYKTNACITFVLKSRC